MQNDVAMLHCPNDLCKAPNGQTDRFCQQCGTPLLKRYLWAVGEGIEAYEPGKLVAERYLIKNSQICLDTQPALPPETPAEITNEIKPYLRLVAYRLHVPQVYGWVLLPGETTKEIWLLEQAPIHTTASLMEGQLMPLFTDTWKNATSMRQLNWLWQIATLWQPLSAEGVASSLLNAQLLRTEGSLLRLLQLQLDSSKPPLSELGQFWKEHLLVGAQRAIAEFLETTCQHLIHNEVQSPQELVAILERSLFSIGRSQTITLSISTRTDTGPSRQRNEDACYPPSGTTKTLSQQEKGLAIVCDGIGGHEGGSVASHLAIETIHQKIQRIALDDIQLEATALSHELEAAANAANDQISARNDSENRLGRQRMGTTLVMALARDHEMYISHVGDSRAYWITRHGCYQVTLDDDVASREVRLGYALYRNALQHSSSGFLVQALGMSPSMHPTVQRFVLDEDCVFLLCSDGLSDYDRVEQFWETEVLPILDRDTDVAAAVTRLVEIANIQNGHDNVTIGMIYCQVSYCEPESAVAASIAAPSTSQSTLASTVAVTAWEEDKDIEQAYTAISKRHAPVHPATPPKRSYVTILIGLASMLLVGIGMLAFYISKIEDRLQQDAANSDLTNEQPPTSKVTPSVSPFLSKGTLLQTKSDIQLSRLALPLDQAIASQSQQSFSGIKGILPAGSVLQVLEPRLSVQQELWLNLKVCSIPSREQAGKTKSVPQPKTSSIIQPSPDASSANLNAVGTRLLQKGDDGWIQEAKIQNLIQHLPSQPAPDDLERQCAGD